MNIVVAGIPRSGSTRLYNIVRLGFLQQYSPDLVNSEWVTNFKPSDNQNILKIHQFSEKWLSWSDYVFTCKRDLRYIAASAIDLMPVNTYRTTDDIVKMCREILEMYEAWSSHADYELVYEDFSENSESVVSRIFGVLGMNIDIGKLVADLNEIGNSRERFDRRTLMHPNHISGQTKKHYSERLTREQTSVIESVFGSWLVENGYKLI